MFHSIQEIFQNKSLVLKNEGILSTEMLEGFYFETGNRKFFMSVTYNTDTDIKTAVTVVMLQYYANMTPTDHFNGLFLRH